MRWDNVCCLLLEVASEHLQSNRGAYEQLHKSLNMISKNTHPNAFKITYSKHTYKFALRSTSSKAEQKITDRFQDLISRAKSIQKYAPNSSSFTIDEKSLGLGNSELNSLVCDESISLLKSYTLHHGGPDTLQNLEEAMRHNPLFLITLREHFQSNVGGG